jgi:hypothetical protein
MGDVIGELLPLALGVAVSPVPIIAVILVLITPRARSNGPAFLVGWVGAVAVVTVVAMAVLGVVGSASEDDTSTIASLVRVVLGLLLLAGAARNWHLRPRHGEVPPMPAWMSALDEFSPGRSLGVAALLAGVNPKNLMLNVAAGTTIAAGSLSTAEQAVSLLAYVAIASISILAPLIAYFALGSRAADVLGGWKDWLTAHDNAVMAVLFLVLGAVVLGKGVGGLV